MNPSDLITRFERNGQGHVFQFFDSLDPASKKRLLLQAEGIDLDEVDMLVQTYVRGDGITVCDFNQLEPAPYIPHPRKDPVWTSRWEEARTAGEAALRAGKVAAFVVAGGQGTRLGYDAPKGTFPVTPVSRATLFEVFAGKIAYASKRYGAPIPWFIMTSGVNHEATVAFLESHHYFGLNPAHVHCFTQGLMPAVDLEGKLILEDKDRLMMTPDGHGGSLRALNRSGAIATMRAMGIEAISYYQVDNPLVQIIDPAFIGFHLLGGSEMSSKMIPKAYPLEKVGHFCIDQGRMTVVEYSDLPQAFQEQRTPSGELRFISGSIAIHIFDVGFVERIGGTSAAQKLPFHKAVKKIPYLDEAGNTVKPEQANGVKFEMFVFDALPFAQNPVLIETLRDEDFSPVKNAEGVDSPETCRRDQLKLWAKWLNLVGVTVPRDAEGVPTINFEVAPSFACDAESFIDAWKQLPEPLRVDEGTILS